MKQPKESLGFARLMMVLSSISPLFILWAVRGTPLISDYYFILICALMIVAPNGFLYWRIQTAIRNRDLRAIVVGSAEDQRSHLLIYLFAMLLPLYAVQLEQWRELATTLAALIFIIFLFWHLNMHYMNIFFALWKYRVFNITTNSSSSSVSGKATNVLITKRLTVQDGDKINGYRISNTVYIEIEDKT